MSPLAPSAHLHTPDGIVSHAQWLASVAHMGMWLSAALSGRTHPEEVPAHLANVRITWEGATEPEGLVLAIGHLRTLGATATRLRIHSPGDMPRLLPDPLGTTQLMSGADLVAVNEQHSHAVLIPMAERDGLWPWSAAASETEVVAHVAQIRRLERDEIDQATQALTDLGATTPHTGIAGILRDLAHMESSLMFPRYGDAGTFFRGLRLWVIATLARSVLTPVPTSSAMAKRDEVLTEVARVARRTMEASCQDHAR